MQIAHRGSLLKEGAKSLFDKLMLFAATNQMRFRKKGSESWYKQKATVCVAWVNRWPERIIREKEHQNGSKYSFSFHYFHHQMATRLSSNSSRRYRQKCWFPSTHFRMALNKESKQNTVLLTIEHYNSTHLTVQWNKVHKCGKEMLWNGKSRKRKWCKMH